MLIGAISQGNNVDGGQGKAFLGFDGSALGAETWMLPHYLVITWSFLSLSEDAGAYAVRPVDWASRSGRAVE
jgi:hypothetical protein